MESRAATSSFMAGLFWALAAGLALSPHALADRGVVARSSATAEVAAAQEAPSAASAVGPPLISVPLQKQYVPVMRDNKTIAYKTAYFGRIRASSGAASKTFTVVFDTGSGHFILPSTSCDSETCRKHRRYDRSASQSAVDIEYDGTLIRPDATERDQVSIAFGTGEVLGEFVREVVCLGGDEDSDDELTAKVGEPTKEVAAASAVSQEAAMAVAAAPSEAIAAGGSSSACVTLRVVLATDMTADPFGLFAFDGVLGLGLDSLTLDPHFSFFGQLVEQHPSVLPRFAVYLASHDGGESSISFGGHDARRASTDIQWAPVAMQELGYWQVQIKSIRIGDKELDYCADGTCRAILDTGTSLLGVPRQAARPMHRLMARQVPDGSYTDPASIDCRTVPGQNVNFDLGGVVVSLGVQDYSRPTPFNMTIPDKATSRLFCRSLMLPVDMEAPLGPKVFIWGEPVLRRYYTVYDLAEKRIGFSLARTPPEGFGGKGLPAVGSPPVGSLLSGAPLPPVRAGMPEAKAAEATEATEAEGQEAKAETKVTGAQTALHV